MNLLVIRVKAPWLLQELEMNISPRKTTFTFDEAVDVWLRSWSGQLGDDIAHDYRINAGRVSEVLSGTRNPGSRQAASSIRKQQSIA